MSKARRTEAPIASKASHEERKAGAVRGLVARLAKGNVRLQMGRYMTAKQIEQKRKRILRHSFQ